MSCAVCIRPIIRRAFFSADFCASRTDVVEHGGFIHYEVSARDRIQVPRLLHEKHLEALTAAIVAGELPGT